MVAEHVATDDDLSSNLFTHSNEAELELEFQSEHAYRVVNKAGAPRPMR
jgi:hypothetical protein